GFCRWAQVQRDGFVVTERIVSRVRRGVLLRDESLVVVVSSLVGCPGVWRFQSIGSTKENPTLRGCRCICHHEDGGIDGSLRPNNVYQDPKSVTEPLESLQIKERRAVLQIETPTNCRDHMTDPAEVW